MELHSLTSIKKKTCISQNKLVGNLKKQTHMTFNHFMISSQCNHAILFSRLLKFVLYILLYLIYTKM